MAAILPNIEAMRRHRRFGRLFSLALSAYRSRHIARLPFAIRQLSHLRCEQDLARLSDATLHGLWGMIAPLQVRSELLRMIEFVRQFRPERLLEIGTARGGTLFMLCRSAAPNAEIYSIDMPGGWFGGGYPKWRVPLYRAFAEPPQRVKLLRANSHADETFTALCELLGGRRLDFLFIDGDHTYEGVKTDFERYRQLVAPGGWIGFHDIVPNPQDPVCQVDRYWQEVKRDYHAVEFVEDWAQQGKGIGLIRI